MNFRDSQHELALDLLSGALMQVDQIPPPERRSVVGTRMKPWNGAWDRRFFLTAAEHM
jgi:hypothetical protein